jgi:orotidine-5'-phosphate decarboxylase
MLQKNKIILPHEYIIFPLDFPSLDEAIKFINLLHDHVGLFKVGLELFVKEGPKVLQAIAKATHTKIFLDMKFHDIPETVSAAQKAARFHGAKFITVHCDEGTGLLKAVVDSAKNGTQVLGVTVLTSLSAKDLEEIGISKELQDPRKLVLHRARLANKANCAGVICSGNEVEAVKKEFGKDFIVVVPGIRPTWGDVPNDDQKRISTPYAAIKNGADYIVVGRPIKFAKSPLDATKRIAEEIEKALKELK